MTRPDAPVQHLTTGQLKRRQGTMTCKECPRVISGNKVYCLDHATKVVGGAVVIHRDNEADLVERLRRHQAEEALLGVVRS